MNGASVPAVLTELFCAVLPLPSCTICKKVLRQSARHRTAENDRTGFEYTRAFVENGFSTPGRLVSGAGFGAAEVKQNGYSHVGISSIRERSAARCGGTLTIESTPGVGAKAVVPMLKENELQ